MTEKRFIQSRHFCIDRIKKRETTDWDIVIKWLNELADENEQLKHQVNCLQDQLDDFIFVEKENEQLKKAIDEADDLIKSHLSVYYNIYKHLGVVLE